MPSRFSSWETFSFGLTLSDDCGVVTGLLILLKILSYKRSTMSVPEELAGLTPDKAVAWYTAEIHDLSLPARSLLENYSKISPDQVIPHILTIVSRQF